MDCGIVIVIVTNVICLSLIVFINKQCLNSSFYLCCRCPVPSCKTPRRRVKRLKPLPAKWSEIPEDQKVTISEELGRLLWLKLQKTMFCWKRYDLKRLILYVRCGYVWER